MDGDRSIAGCGDEEGVLLDENESPDVTLVGPSITLVVLEAFQLHIVDVIENLPAGPSLLLLLWAQPQGKNDLALDICLERRDTLLIEVTQDPSSLPRQGLQVYSPGDSRKIFR